MVSLNNAIYFFFHPDQLRNVLQWKLWHTPVHERDTSKDPESVKKCLDFLQKTSRSFSTVILELHPELLMPVCLFYLILRGLDTIEDDTSIPLGVKEPILREFHDILEKDGWTFNGNRPEEKDRELLVQFDVVIAEFQKVKPAYKTIIKDITKRMGNGMADYCQKAEADTFKVISIEDYDLYCYYVAGLVGEGLTRLFVEAGFANPALLQRPDLYKSMGLFLQKTNIIRDVKEDDVDNRRFWPKEIWSKHVNSFEDLFKKENREAALNCSSEMIHNALDHADECIYYLAGLKEQSIFNFCAIPQSMAIATLELCFRNPAMFDRNIKITKGDACQLMTQSTQNVQVICDVFRRYVRRVHKKNTSKDPSFLKISMVCGKVEKFIETIFPTQFAEEAQLIVSGKKSEEDLKKRKEEAQDRQEVMLLFLSLFIVMCIVTVMMFFAAWFFGARFDLAFKALKSGNLTPPKPEVPSGHGEL